MTDGLPDPEEARKELVEAHDLREETEEACELLDEAISLWDDLEHSGRVARIREAKRLLHLTLEFNRMGVDLESDALHHCPDCGSTNFGSEDIGHGQNRIYCEDCDHTLQVG